MTTSSKMHPYYIHLLTVSICDKKFDFFCIFL